MRTQGQIQAEVDALTELKFKVPPRSKFNDDNKRAIGAQIRVLVERMDRDAVDAAFGPQAFAAAEDFSDYVHQEAVFASMWLHGELKDETLSGDWAGLVRG